MPKLTKASVPMCPECEFALTGEGPSYQCENCGHCCGRTYETNPDYGYFVPDVDTPIRVWVAWEDQRVFSERGWEYHAGAKGFEGQRVDVVLPLDEMGDPDASEFARPSADLAESGPKPSTEQLPHDPESCCCCGARLTRAPGEGVHQDGRRWCSSCSPVDRPTEEGRDRWARMVAFGLTGRRP